MSNSATTRYLSGANLIFAIAFVLIPRLASATEAHGGWIKTANGIALKNKSGSVVRRIIAGQSEKNIGHHPEHKFTDRVFVSTKAAASSDGRFAWVLRDESYALIGGEKAFVSFKYYGQDGEELWEKNTVTGVNVSQNGEVVALLEVDLKWIVSNEHRDGSGRPSVYSSNGGLLFEFGDCRTSFAPYFSMNGRYGAVVCDSSTSQRPAILFNLSKKRKMEIAIPAVGVSVSVHDDGTYALITSQQKFDPATKKYTDEFITEEISHGRIK